MLAMPDFPIILLAPCTPASLETATVARDLQQGRRLGLRSRMGARRDVGEVVLLPSLPPVARPLHARDSSGVWNLSAAKPAAVHRHVHGLHIGVGKIHLLPLHVLRS